MKIKKILAVLLAAAALFTCSVTALSAEEQSLPVSVTVNGSAVDFPDQTPVIRNNRTLVPVRFVAEALGREVEWDPADRSVLIDGGRIILYIGSDRAVIDGRQATLDVESVLIGNRTMIPLRAVAETLDCTVDWFGSIRTVLINARDGNGCEMSVFERFRQSGLFWAYTVSGREYLVPKTACPTLADASSPTAYHNWWIERELDTSVLLNPSLDCSVVMRAFGESERGEVRDLLYTVYPTGYEEAYGLMMQTIRGELWETFYPETSELYPLFSAAAPRSGTFGTRYLDGREAEMYTDYNGTEFVLNISAEGYTDPEKPVVLTADEISAYTKEAKNRYCLGLWGLN